MLDSDDSTDSSVNASDSSDNEDDLKAVNNVYQKDLMFSGNYEFFIDVRKKTLLFFQAPLNNTFLLYLGSW